MELFRKFYFITGNKKQFEISCPVYRIYSFNMARPRKKAAGTNENAPAAQALLIGGNLQKIRTKRGLTQKMLAEKVGLTRGAIAAYEAGRVHLTDISLIDLAKALRVSADEILGIRDSDPETRPLSRRLMKRVIIIESLPEATKRRIIITRDDSIKANTRLSILDD
jgi:transcriptional regulator with XRE-family HTH domain